MMAPLRGGVIGNVPRVVLHRRPYLGRWRKNILKPAGHHADDFVAAAVKCDPVPDDSAITAEPPLPQAIAEDHYSGAAEHVVRGLEITSQPGRYSQHAKITCAHALSFQALRLGRPRPRRRPRLHCA